MPVITPLFDIRIKSSDAEYRIPTIKRIKITSSRDIAPDKALVSLPMMKGLDLNTFKKGDEVTIQLGHKENSSMKTVFLGYITKVGANLPVKIECEDVWSQVRERKKSQYYNFSSVLYSEIAKNLIGDITEITDINTIAPDTDRELTENFHVDKQSYQQVFDWLVKHSGWDFYVIPGTRTFYFGPGLYKYNHQVQTETPVFRRGLNIIRSNLKWREGGDVEKVRIFTSDPDFKKRSKDPVGEYSKPGVSDPTVVKDIFIAGIQTDKKKKNKKSARQKGDERAKEEFDKLNASGFEGSLMTFGQSRLMHSMKCRIDEVDHRHASEHCFIEKIVYEFGPDIGFKMSVSVDPVLSVGIN